MNYKLTKDVIGLLEEFEEDAAHNAYQKDIDGFKAWISGNAASNIQQLPSPDWEGKADGRSPESVISTMIVRMNRFGKMYSKLAISGSAFSTQEDFIYLINLKALGAMTKMELIRKNIQDKPTGMQIIGRLIAQGWVKQNTSDTDRRSKVITITPEGIQALEAQMPRIRQATRIVSGNLTHVEKMELIRLLRKLDDLHEPIFNTAFTTTEPLEEITRNYLNPEN